jgi:thioesterase domain-containing protein
MKGPNALEKLVRNMVSALCETQTQGPYYLCGYCQDGLFAYELARQLEMYGHEVGLLAMVETRNPAPHFRVRVVNSVRRNAMRVAFQADQLCRLARNGNHSEYVRARREQWRRFLLRLSTRITPRGKLRARQSARLDVQEFLYLEACFSRPKPLSCRTAIFRCAEWPIPSGGDPYFGWRELLTGRAETYEIPGDHEGIFREPNVRALAAKLKGCLRDASHAETPAYEVTMDAVRTHSRT